MVDYSADIAALDAAIALGATRVQYDNGRIVEFDSFEALLARRRFLIGLQDNPTPLARPPRSAFATFDRGDC